MVIILISTPLLLSLNPSTLSPLSWCVMVTLVLWGLAFHKLCTSKGSVLVLLLTLEIFMLTTLIVVVFYAAVSSMSSMVFMTLFTLAVCEASLGLGLLISFVRTPLESLTSLQL